MSLDSRLRPKTAMNGHIRSAYRALRSAARMAASGGRGVLLEIGGERFRVAPETAAATDRRYEQGKYEAVMATIERGMTVFDIGAHQGVYTLGMANRAGIKGRVVAFEPHPVTAAILQRNAQLNQAASRIYVESMAVGDSDGESELWTDDSDLTSNSLRRCPSSEKPIRVRTTTLDTYCAARGYWPEILKIDVEGFEREVVAGGLKLFRRPETRAVHIEIHSGRGVDPEQILRIGESLGFRVLNFLGQPIPESARRGACHVMWRR